MQEDTTMTRDAAVLPWLRGSDGRMILSWDDESRRSSSVMTKRLTAYSRFANSFDDTDTVIEMMLTEARDASRADGGTFYLVTPEGRLRIAYFQNDTLSNGVRESRNRYVNAEMKIDESSISGYAALSKEPLNITDVHNIPDCVPYKFNAAFDASSGYRTVSMLTIPVLGPGGIVQAVLQLINKLDAEGQPCAFDDADVHYAELLAFQSVPCLTKSIMTRRLITSMLRMSEMRDPLETGAHVHRVGAFAAEIYEQWARDHGVEFEEMFAVKDTLRLAAMLHDIGKVGVPDAVLKKPGKLTDEEFEIIKTHSAMGARIYDMPESRLERMAYDITLHHHQRWDGKGYTGDPNEPQRAGEDIPLCARITSVSDVLDALTFRRVYKEAWGFDKAMEEIRRCSGTQFDPDVVTAAEKTSPTLRAIIERYQ